MGNRLTEVACSATPTCTPVTTAYTYDDANRLETVNSAPYTWDDNGNLLVDGTFTYTYDAANRLIAATDGTTTSGFAYNGLGDRVSQTVAGVVTTYTLDLAAGLTQVLDDGTNTYLYGNGRIAQDDGVEFAYFLSDALGSVRQLADESGAVTLARSYEPYGDVLTSVGTGITSYGFTGEQYDGSTGLLYLRARYYAGGVGRFTARDTWTGIYTKPQSLNRWAYVEGDPINHTDPTGRSCSGCRTPGDWAKCTLYYGYGISLDATFEDSEETLILETVEEYADLLGGRETFRQNVPLTRIGEGWATGSFAFYSPADKSITLDYQWYETIMGLRPKVGYEIVLCQPNLEEIFGFPDGSLTGVELQAKFVLAHEIGHALHTGNYRTYRSFEEEVELPLAILAHFNSNPLIGRNAGRETIRFEVFADVLAAYLYSPTLLNEDMSDWVENSMPASLK